MRHEALGVLVKRVAETRDDGSVRVVGENPRSSLSEAMGWIARREIRGRVFYGVRKGR